MSQGKVLGSEEIEVKMQISIETEMGNLEIVREFLEEIVQYGHVVVHSIDMIQDEL